jgi:hypothetical protein
LAAQLQNRNYDASQQWLAAARLILFERPPRQKFPCGINIRQAAALGLW